MSITKAWIPRSETAGSNYIHMKIFHWPYHIEPQYSVTFMTGSEDKLLF